MIRTPREDKDGGSANSQEPQTGTPKSVPENVTWRSRPDFQTVSVRGVEAEANEETDPEIGEVDEFPMEYHKPPEIDFPVEKTPLPQIGWVVGGGLDQKTMKLLQEKDPRQRKLLTRWA